MSATTVITCDRCRREILEDRTILKVTTGPRRHEPPVDLCGPCSTRFADWLSAPAADHRASPSTPR